MTEKQDSTLYHMVRGFPTPHMPWFTKENMEDAMDFVPGDGDLILATYPKTGTTWMQYIILQIKSKGEYFPSLEDVTYKIVPFLEMTGVEPVKAQKSPRFYKHHIPYNLVPKNEKSKCIYVYRHPEDTVVSYYHFTKDLMPDWDLDFDFFFESFLTGKIGYGDYFKHILSFYEHRQDGNLLLVSYEKLHANRKEEILRIAKFLGEEYYQNLIECDETVEQIIERTSFDSMKKNLKLARPDVKEEEDGPKVSFFRKGIVGDGKTILTDAQCHRLKEAAEEILKETSILEEWYKK